MDSQISDSTPETLPMAATAEAGRRIDGGRSGCCMRRSIGESIVAGALSLGRMEAMGPAPRERRAAMGAPGELLTTRGTFGVVLS